MILQRGFQCKDNRVTLFELRAFRNHTRRQYKEITRGGMVTENKAIQKIRGLIWIVLGL